MWPWPPPAQCPHCCDKHSEMWLFDVGLGSATPTTAVRLHGRGQGATWLTRRRAYPTTGLRCRWRLTIKGDPGSYSCLARTQCCSPRLSRPAEIWPPRDAVAQSPGVERMKDFPNMPRLVYSLLPPWPLVLCPRYYTPGSGMQSGPTLKRILILTCNS
jgi:hypothetical protein